MVGTSLHHRGGLEVVTLAKRVATASVAALVVAVAGCSSVRTEQPAIHPHNRPASAPAYGKLPLHFERNDGQTNSRVDYLARGSGYGLFLSAGEAVLKLNRIAEEGECVRPPLVVRARLVRARSDMQVAAENPLPGRSNYFIGNDPSKWRTNIPHFGRVTYRGVWTGIDLSYYGSDQHQLEYDFVVQPGADPGVIQLEYDGVERIELDDAGNLVLHIAGGELVQSAPVIYQDVRSARRAVRGRFVVTAGERVGFEVEAFDRSLPLVIDPTLSYSTYLGGTGSDNAYGIAVDAQRNAYVTGTTTSADFPTQVPYQTDQALADVFVTRLSATGNALVFSTYLGGSADDYGNAVAIDSSGKVLLTGYTLSTDFPTLNPYQTDQTGTDAFVTRLDSGGALSYSTYLGGGGDDRGFDLAVDSNGFAYVTGYTTSTNFPTHAQFYYQTDQSGTDAFVTMLNASGIPEASTYLGGNLSDFGTGIAVSPSNEVYVTGYTTSTNFPTQGPYQTFQSGTDAFVTKFGANWTSLAYSTYLGGNSTDTAYGIAVDAAGSAYVTGSTDSTNYPTFNPYQTDRSLTDGFVTKLSANGSSLAYSTYLGGGSTDSARGIAIDGNGCAYVAGYTLSSDFPTQSALQTNQPNTDAFVTRLSASGNSLVYSTYLGGSGNDYAYAIAVDAEASAYVAGVVESTNFPTQTPYQASHGGGTQDVFVSKLWGRLTIADRAVFEGNSGTATALFDVTLEPPASSTVTVDYATSAGSAIEGDDYQSVNGTLTFLTGETTKSIEVLINGDPTGEPDETFFVTLSNASGATITDAQATGTILDDDSAPPVLNVADKAVTEGNSGTTLSSLPVSLSYARGVAVTVDYQTSSGTAQTPGDYTATSGTLTFSPGTMETNIVLSTAGDTLVERRETFSVTLSNPAYASIGDGTGTVTINDDDTIPARTGDLAYDRNGHTATLLPDGRVLAASGGTAEIFDPATGTWSLTTAPPVSLSNHAAAVLPSGRVMIAGGTSVSVFNPATAQWTAAPALNETRSGHTMTVLQDGRVLVVGGYDRQTVETYVESGGTWTHGTAASLSPVRTDHTATRLADGRVLVVGGWVSSGNSLTDASLFDPVLNTWTAANPLTTGRHSHTATLLPDGRVLVAGGFASWSATSWTAACEIYDPGTGQWSATGALTQDRATAVAALLGTGEVLVAGGNFASYTDMEIYSPAMGTWTSAGQLGIARRSATATLLTDGRVLIVGGNGFQEENKGFTAELVDASAGGTRAASSLTVARSEHSSTLLTDGTVLVVGGGDASYEIYDRTAGASGTWTRTAQALANRREQAATLLPNGSVLVTGGGTGDSDGSTSVSLFTSGVWTSLATMSAGRRGHTATLLVDGRVLVAGGLNTWATSSAQIFDGSAWTSAGTMSTGRWRHTATRLPSGEVLVAGGQATIISEYLRSAEIYDPQTNTWRAIAPMSSRRTGHVALALRDGRIFVAGGNDDSCPAVASAEVYDPARNVWTPVAPMGSPRSHFTATLLWDGKILVAGGQNCLTDLSTVEIWDPVADRWITGNWSLSARFSHTATLLTTGEILFTGGEQTANPSLTGAVLFDPTGSQPSLGPELAPIPTAITYGETVNLSGNRLRASSEAASGGTQSSASDLPVVEMRSVEGSQIVALLRDGIASPPAGISVSQLPDNLGAGWYSLRVATSGVASSAQLVRVACSVKVTSITGPASPVVAGQPAIFTVTAQGGRRYQWQRCITGTCAQESEWTNILGATTAIYTLPGVTGADAGTKFRAVVTGNCASETSSPVPLAVADAAPPSASVLYPAGGEYWLLSPTDGNPPNTKVVAWSMADDVRVCRVVASLVYSNDGGTTYSPAPAGGGLPASFGSDTNCVYPGESTKTVTYTVPTAFPSGRSGSLYKIQVVVTDQANKTTTVTSANPFYIVQPNPDSVKTLIIWNRARMIGRQGITTGQADQIAGKLQELANHPRVLGLVVDLSAVTSISSLYTTWDADAANSTKANNVLFGTGGIHEYLLTSLLSAYSGVKYLVVVGDDRIIPMARVQDRTALLPESAYANGEDISPTATTVGQALAANKYLTDDPLAVLDTVPAGELDGSVYIPDLAVGRLVETPTEIVTTIATYISQDGILDLSLLNPTTGHKVLVTGYDFLSNVAMQMRTRWKAALGDASGDTSIAPVDGTLLTGTWDLGSVPQRAAALRTKLTGNGGSRYGVMAIAGHATHYEEGVPGTNPFDIQGLSTADLYGPDTCATPSLGAVDLSGGVLYGVGCHGGLPVPGSCRTDASRSLDLPQTMLGRGVAAYVANSGYGWSLKYGIGYGGRLVQIFTEQITSGGTIAVGEAVRQSKQRYYLESPRYDAYDEKSLMQWTLFGLPMYVVKTGIAPGAATTPARPASDGLPDTETIGPVRVSRSLSTTSPLSAQAVRTQALPAYLTQLSLSFDFTASGVYSKRDSAGTLLPAGPGCPDANGCYYTLNGLVDRGTGSGDLPIQPYLIYDSRLAGTSQHGVLWKGGTYDEETGWTPVIAELISNGGSGSNHGAAPRVIQIRPTAPRVVPGVDSPSCRPSDLEVNTLTLAAGEAVKPAANLTYSIARRYRNIDLEVFYFNNSGSPGANCDRTGPALGAGPYAGAYHQVSDSSINWTIPATDSAGVWRVVVVYNANTVNAQSRGLWIPLELADNGVGAFTGSATVTGTSQLTYALQAVDNRGNVTWLDFTSADLPSSGVPLGVPQTVDVTMGSIGAPSGVVAAATAPTSVALSWTPVTGAARYDIYRKASIGASYAPIGSSVSPSYTDDTAASAAAYLYAVKAVDNGDQASPYSAPDLATTVIFDDPAIEAGVTVVKGVHITQLRSAVLAVRTLAALAAPVYTDPTITEGVTLLKTAQLSELRGALDAARTALEILPVSYVDPTLTTATAAKAAHINDLRNGVQ